jgi:signal transduction histidine kinase
VPARTFISVPARIALRPRRAKDVGVRALRLAAFAVWFVTVVSMAVAALQVFDLLPTTRLDWLPGWMVPFLAVAVLTPASVGLVIAIRRPSNAIAWILLVGALVIAAVPLDLVLSEGWALQLDRAMWPLLYAWPIAVAFVFPNGRLLSPRWRWVAGAGAASFLGFMTFAMFDPEPFYGDDADVPNPLADNAVAAWLEGMGLAWMWVVLWLGILGSLLAGALAVRLRLRRSSGIERLQVMWLAWAAALIPLGLLLCGASSWIFGDSILDLLLFPFLLLMQAAVAAAIGIAVARYRLYAIERLINQTAVYGALTLLLAGTYVAVSLATGIVVGHGSDWVTAAATLGVALAFRPLRSRVQGLVDRRYSRARYDALRQVRAFEEQVREGRRAPEEIGRVLAQALHDPLAELFFWLPASETFADWLGELVAELPQDGRTRSEVDRDGARTAVLLHDPSLLDQRDLLDGVLGAAALSIEIARLRVEVRLQLAEVEASRARIVEAGYEERRRLERDLHDGAQQRLVSLGVQIRRMQRSLPPGAAVLVPAFDGIVDEVGAAISDLRQIAAGVRPARLDDGLAAALRDLARSAPVPVEVDAPVERVAASIEAAAYFVACEALTNAVKHAGASKVSLRAVRENGTLLVTVADDGVGGAIVRRGSGLSGLQDRVAAHGGTLAVESPRGGGTRVEVGLPCDS